MFCTRLSDWCSSTLLTDQLHRLSHRAARTIYMRCSDIQPIIGIGQLARIRRLSFTQLVSASFYFYYQN